MVQSQKRRRLHNAGSTPGGPEVEQHHLAPVRARVHGLSREGGTGEGELVRGVLEDRHGAVAAHIAGRVRGVAWRTAHKPQRDRDE